MKMKKLVCAALALLMGMSATAALAQTTLVERWSTDTLDTDFVYGGDYLAKMEDGALSILLPDGTPLTDTRFDKAWSCRHGYLILGRQVDGKVRMGALNADGAEIIPFQYDFVNVLSDGWGYGMNGTAVSDRDEAEFTAQGTLEELKVDTVDLYRLPGGACVTTLPRERIADMMAFGRYVNILDRETGIVTCYDGGFNPIGEVSELTDDALVPKYTVIAENGLEGLANPDGSTAVPPTWVRVDPEVINGYFKVSDGEYWGLADLTGALVVPIAYDDFEESWMGYTTWETSYGYVANGYAGVLKDGNLGFYRIGVGETCPPETLAERVSFNGVSATWMDDDGVTHILAADGVDTAMTDSTFVRDVEFSLGVYYRAGINGEQHLVDWHGESVLTTARNFALSGSGNLLLSVSADGEKLYELQCDDFDAPAEPAAAPAEADEAPSQVEGAFAGTLRDLFKNSAG